MTIDWIHLKYEDTICGCDTFLNFITFSGPKLIVNWINDQEIHLNIHLKWQHYVENKDFSFSLSWMSPAVFLDQPSTAVLSFTWQALLYCWHRCVCEGKWCKSHTCFFSRLLAICGQHCEKNGSRDQKAAAHLQCRWGARRIYVISHTLSPLP